MILLAVLSTVYACTTIIPPKWEYEEEAIKLQIKASSDLHWQDDKPHTLHLCVYQLRDRNEFDHLAGYDEGLSSLVNYRCEFVDPTVIKPESLFVYPGKPQSVTLSRAREAKYIAIAAGYERLSKDRSTKVIEIPLITVTKGFISRKKIQKPGHLNIEIILGKEQILDIHEIKGK